MAVTQSTQDRVAEIEKRMSILSAKKRRLHGQILSSSGATVPELNEVCREITRLDLERDRLLGR